jgi:competence protein ComFC
MPANLLNRMSSHARSLLDVVYPRQCLVCGDVLNCDRFPFFCEDCHAAAPRLGDWFCDRCGHPFAVDTAGGNATDQCPNCFNLSIHYERAVSAMRYRGVVQRALQELKYSGRFYWLPVIDSWMEEALIHHRDHGLQEVSAIIPVPLHRRRERERGFNQSTLIAKSIARTLQVPLHENWLIRTRPTRTQTNLDREERMENLRKAFEIGKAGRLAGTRILLVDDVLTTGSTANECARILLEAGAGSVLVFTLARG